MNCERCGRSWASHMVFIHQCTTELVACTEHCECEEEDD